MEFMPEHAPLAVLAFLGTVALLALTIFAALMTRKKRVVPFATAFAFCVLSAYGLALLGVSLTSHEKVLAPGERKYFCEIDCHIAYSVVGMQETALPAGALQSTSHRLVTVQLKTWFDPSTISARRGNSPLAPGQHRVFLVDDHGRQFPLASSNQPPTGNEFPTPASIRASLLQPLRPGESDVTPLVFDVPTAARNLRLFVGDDFVMPDVVLIGHEDSFLHRKIYFALNATDTISAGRVP